MTELKRVTGCTSYKGLTAQQHDNVFTVFEEFLSDIKPARILEIGTAGGGFTLFLRHTLNSLGLETSVVRSLEVHEMTWYDSIRNENVQIDIINVFDQAYFNLEKPEVILPFIQQEGTTLVLCDGGHKIAEFNTIAPHLKVGDYIMAHDYIDVWDNFKENYVDKIWNWCEIEEKYIEKISIEHNLVHVNKEKFDSVVWVCKKKII